MVFECLLKLSQFEWVFALRLACFICDMYSMLFTQRLFYPCVFSFKSQFVSKILDIQIPTDGATVNNKKVELCE